MRDASQATPPSDLILYQTEDGKTRIQCRFEDDNLWLTQAQIGELYQKDVKKINEHLLNIYEEKELVESSTIRKFRIVRIEGKRELAREISHYSLQAILAVGFRVRSQVGPCLSRAGVWQPAPRRIRTATGAEAKIEATAANRDQP
jgi:hypothetical protein